MTAPFRPTREAHRDGGVPPAGAGRRRRGALGPADRSHASGAQRRRADERARPRWSVPGADMKPRGPLCPRRCSGCRTPDVPLFDVGWSRGPRCVACADAGPASVRVAAEGPADHLSLQELTAEPVDRRRRGRCPGCRTSHVLLFDVEWSAGPRCLDCAEDAPLVESPPARRCPAAQGARQGKPHRATRQGSLPPLRHARRPSPQGGVEPNPFLLGLQGRHATASSSPATEDRPGCRPCARGDRPGAEGERASERHGFAATWPGHAGDAPAAGPERE